MLPVRHQAINRNITRLLSIWPWRTYFSETLSFDENVVENIVCELFSILRTQPDMAPLHVIHALTCFYHNSPIVQGHTKAGFDQWPTPQCMLNCLLLVASAKFLNVFLLEAVYVIAEPYFALSSHHFQEHYCDGVDSNVHNHRENHWSTDFLLHEISSTILNNIIWCWENLLPQPIKIENV